jgi:hypothetical protein
MSRAAIIALFACAACGGAKDARLRIAVALGEGTPAPSELRLDVFDRLGRVFEGAPLADRGGAIKLPGDVVIVLDGNGGWARAIVRGTGVNGTPLEAAGQGPLAAGRETRIDLVLSDQLLPDADQDGVPDLLDNCPADSNADQAPAADGVVGAACATDPAPDLGGSDGPLVVNAPPDGSTPLPDLLQTQAVCGNGTVEAGEGCDDGANNNDNPLSTATCTSLCRRRAPCGNMLGSLAARIDPATGHCYVHWPTLRNWAGAQRDCEGRGGHLVSITATGENDLVTQLVGNQVAWIGLTVVHGGGAPVSKWVTGEPFAFSAYAKMEPNNYNGVEECVVTAPLMSGWDDRPCGFPTRGNLPASPTANLGYVCESNCGNGVVEPGEECEPPGSATCTTFCQTRRACTETGAITLLTNGHCYFRGATAVNYSTARTSCPAGTHLATLDGLAENEAGLQALGGNTAWLALRAPTTPGLFAWDNPGDTFQSRRFHGFTFQDEPNHNTPPACVRFTPAEGWRDNNCAELYLPLCERE